MPTRKHFMAAAASVPLLAAAPAPPSPQPSAPSAPSPKPTASKKKISPLAREFASRMRDFDPALSDKELDTIASGIEDNLKLGSQVNPKGRALKNWDEPVTLFEVPE
jgi:hypothetical protein